MLWLWRAPFNTVLQFAAVFWVEKDSVSVGMLLVVGQDWTTSLQHSNFAMRLSSQGRARKDCRDAEEELTKRRSPLMTYAQAQTID